MKLNVYLPLAMLALFVFAVGCAEPDSPVGSTDPQPTTPAACSCCDTPAVACTECKDGESCSTCSAESSACSKEGCADCKGGCKGDKCCGKCDQGTTEVSTDAKSGCKDCDACAKGDSANCKCGDQPAPAIPAESKSAEATEASAETK